MKNKLLVGDQIIEYETAKTDKGIVVIFNDKKYEFTLKGHIFDRLIFDVDGKNHTLHYAKVGEEKQFYVDQKEIFVSKLKNKKSVDEINLAPISPMPGKVFKVLVKAGDEVKKGTPLLVLEAMKMEHTIKANIDGKIKKVFFKEGEMVQGGVILVEFEN